MASVLRMDVLLFNNFTALRRDSMVAVHSLDRLPLSRTFFSIERGMVRLLKPGEWYRSWEWTKIGPRKCYASVVPG